MYTEYVAEVGDGGVVDGELRTSVIGPAGTTPDSTTVELTWDIVRLDDESLTIEIERGADRSLDVVVVSSRGEVLRAPDVGPFVDDGWSPPILPLPSAIEIGASWQIDRLGFFGVAETIDLEITMVREDVVDVVGSVRGEVATAENGVVTRTDVTGRVDVALSLTQPLPISWRETGIVSTQIADGLELRDERAEWSVELVSR